jgi:hypothetical protein
MTPALGVFLDIDGHLLDTARIRHHRYLLVDEREGANR